ncbi:DUF262 domain-containing protein [Thermococcus gorgonarius]|uniref:DUF262 domain-containing protein n=1 Tax=Thermococcus gorgonarius TaxID=71997 RepID=A0A2Z2MD99_THEGO|nr:DUF262 domain-containing protein [Thermococcus gorgonarius]ASJ00038.1 hypothetical protein A3K92_00330 [Thermococcus gorgonarius]
MSENKPIIEAKEVNVVELLSNKFYRIPIYQRPFSWKEENFQEFVEDILDAIEDDQPSYFLGSILLRSENDGMTYEIVDGQQRLTSLIVLLSVFRDYLNDEGLHWDWIVSKGNEYAGIPPREKIKVWSDLQELFSEYIYKIGGTSKFIDDVKNRRIILVDKDSPAYHPYEAITTFRNFVESLDRETMRRFLKYLFQNVYFVRIITTDRSSAFRLFNVLNTRGLPLSSADVLKSMNLEPLPEEAREEYFRKWRNLEEDIGREGLENLLGWIRAIYTEEKAKRELVEEFEKLFKENKIEKGEGFFKLVLEYGEIYRDKILDPQIVGLIPWKKVRYITLIDIMNRFLPFSEWVSPLLLFYKKFRDEESLYNFAFMLERKLFIEWCADFTATERTTSAISLIRLIKNSNSPQDVLEKMFEHTEEFRRGRERRKIDFNDKELVRKILLSKVDDSQFYTLKGGKMARYLLLRLDMEMQEENFPGYANIGTITVEHILPRSPNDKWLEIFSEDEVKDIVHKLGNLTLLNKRKNSRASNYEFSKKKKKYFEVERSPFAITSMLREYKVWDKKAFQKRHKELLDLTFRIYLSQED